MANSIFSGFWMSLAEVALGRSSLTTLVNSGAVTMKITNSTSTTSISGTMLISAMGWEEDLRSKLPKAIGYPPRLVVHGGERHTAGATATAGGLQRASDQQEVQQLEGEGVELGG